MTQKKKVPKARSYIVPVAMPQYCNYCPFGRCLFSKPLTNCKHGYVCNIEYLIKGRYEHIAEVPYSEDIPRPEWCYLKEV